MTKVCACMGPVHREPFCPCEMERRGLPPSIARIKEETKFADFVKSGGMDEILRNAAKRSGEPTKKGADHG